MIHTLLDLTRPIILLDAETTGVNPGSRIVELGFQLYTSAGLQKEWRSLVNPEISIPPETTRVHNITDEDVTVRCSQCGKLAEHHPVRDDVEFLLCDTFERVPTFREIAPSLAKGFANCDYAGKSVRFDLRVLTSEFQRVRVPWHYAGAAVIDADRLEQLGEPRTLSHLYKKHTGKDLQDAHTALGDVRATAEVIHGQLTKYSRLPREVRQLHDLQWPGWLDEDGKFRLVNGIATCCFGKYNGQPMETIPSNYWDWILRSDFSEGIKHLAREAKLCRYPGER